MRPDLKIERCIPYGYIVSLQGTLATGMAKTPASAISEFYLQAERRLAILTQRNWPSDLGEVILLREVTENESGLL
jgi:hypothetical protein